MANNRKCSSCGIKYSYCPSCSRIDALKPAYFAEFCSESCATLWTTLTKFGMSRLTKSEAKEIISALDLKPIDAYVACVQRDYDKVMAEEKKSRKIKKLEPVVEVEPVVEPIVETVIEQPVAEVALEPVEAVVEESTVHEVVLKEEE